MPQVNISNQKPFDFNTIQLKLNDPMQNIQELVQNDFTNPLVDKLLQPMQPNQPVKVTVDGNDMPKDELIQNFTENLTNSDINIPQEEVLSLITHRSSYYRDKQPQNYKQVVANSFMLSNKAPLPTPTLIYTYDTDIQNPAKDVLMNPTPDNLKALKIGLYGNLTANPLSDRWTFVLLDNDNYEAVKQTLNQNIQANSLNSDTKKFNQDVQSINLEADQIFTSWVTGENIDPDTFNRYVQQTVQNLKTNNGLYELLPINLEGLINPVGFSFINIEALANGNQTQYQKELNQMQSITNRLKTFKYIKIKKVKAAHQMQNQGKRATQKGYQKNATSISARKQKGFSKTLPSAKRQLKRMRKIVNKHISKMQSDNSFKTHSTSFMRANRRHPDDINLRGSIQRTSYRPDIHIYLDTSGSISEEQYKTAIMLLIKIAKILNTNLYFNSFSHYISDPIKLKTKNVGPKKIYQQIQRVPKVDGGTEYENVWRMIDTIDRQNRKRHKAPRLNFMITDFAYDINSSWIPEIHKASTKNTYYMPLAADQQDYANVRSWGMEFANQMIDKHDYNIKRRMLM